MKSDNKSRTERTSEETTHKVLKKKKKKARDKMLTPPADTETKSGPALPKAAQQERGSGQTTDYHVGQIAAMLHSKPTATPQRAQTKLATMFGAAASPVGQTTEALFIPRPRMSLDSTNQAGQRSQTVKATTNKRKVPEWQQTSPPSDEEGPSSGKEVSSSSKASRKDSQTDVAEAKTAKPKERYKPTAEETSRTVFVGNLPMSYNKKKLRKLFKKFGEIKSIRFRSMAPSDPELPKRVIAHTKQFHPERNSMNGYILFHEVEAAQKALKRNGKLVDKNHIRVDLAGNSRKHDTKRSIFLGNLPFDVKDDTIRDHFTECGTVESVRVIRDAKTGLGKGFGYLLFAEDVSVEFALKMDGSRMAGRDIRVQRATKQKQRALNAAKRLGLKQGGKTKAAHGPAKGKVKRGKEKGPSRPKTSGPGPRRPPGQLRKSKAGPARSKGKGQGKRGPPAAGRKKPMGRGKRISS